MTAATTAVYRGSEALLGSSIGPQVRWSFATGDTHRCIRPNSRLHSGRSISTTDGMAAGHDQDRRGTYPIAEGRRQVFINGRLVDDVTIHPAFRNHRIGRHALSIFRRGRKTERLMTFEAPDSGEPAPTASGSCRAAMTIWSSAGGARGLGGTALRLHRPRARSCRIVHLRHVHGARRSSRPTTSRAGALADYYRYAREQRSLSDLRDHQSAGGSLEGRERAEDRVLSAPASSTATRAGITVRGAKMLATGASWRTRSSSPAFSRCARATRSTRSRSRSRCNARVLRFSRASRTRGAPSVFDNPLASRFDENDAVIYFDDVHVPWERVFVAATSRCASGSSMPRRPTSTRTISRMIRLIGEVALSARHRAAHRRDQRHHRFAAGARDARLSWRPRQRWSTRWSSRWKSKGRMHGALLHSRSAHALLRAGPHAAALSAGHRRAARTGRRRHDHAAVLDPRLRQPRNRAA